MGHSSGVRFSSWLSVCFLIGGFAVKVNPALALQAIVAAGAEMQVYSDTIGTGHMSGSLLDKNKKVLFSRIVKLLRPDGGGLFFSIFAPAARDRTIVHCFAKKPLTY